MTYILVRSLHHFCLAFSSHATIRENRDVFSCSELLELD